MGESEAALADAVATVLTFLFAEDQKEHPMPTKAVECLLCKIREFLYGKEGDHHGKKELGAFGDSGAKG